MKSFPWLPILVLGLALAPDALAEAKGAKATKTKKPAAQVDASAETKAGASSDTKAAPDAAAPKPAADTSAQKPAADASTDAKAPDVQAAKESKPSNEVTSKDFTTIEDPHSPVEKPNEVYRFIGLRYREVWVPKFMMNLFGDGGATVAVPMIGPEFTIRKGGFEYVFSIMYAGYSMDPTPFKAKSDPDVAYEIVESSLKVLYLTTDFLWSSEVSPTFAVDYGAGLGLGLVFGDLKRTQAYPPNGTTDPYKYLPCNGQFNPGVTGAGNVPYCNNDNNHYAGYTEPSWADGGSKPIVFPWLALQTGVRWKPVREFMTRLDLGWDLLNGPFIGIAGNYGLPK